MSDRFEIHELAFYVDGKPSWHKVLVPNSSTYLRVSIEKEVARLQAANPKRKYRIRKSRKAKR